MSMSGVAKRTLVNSALRRDADWVTGVALPVDGGFLAA
jgi:hypothetical protein